MRFRNLLITTAIAVVATGSAAYAADAVMEQPPAPPAAPMEVAPVATWAGPYLGAAVGYGFHGKTGNPGGTVDTKGIVVDGFAGYQWQSGSFVYGVEGDVGYNGMDGSDNGYDSDSSIDGSLRARLGFAATDNLLIYATGGGAAERLEVDAGFGSDKKTLYGYTVGAGLDAKLTENVFARAEYRYTDYGDKTFHDDLGGYKVDDSNHKVLLGVGVKF